MAKQAKRTAIYFDEYPNCRIRERSENMKSHELADKISRLAGEVISPEAIRQWRGGYVRPDMSKIPAIAKALDCTADYLFGLEAQPNHVASDIYEVTGLTAKAIDTLRESVWKKSHKTMISDSPDCIDYLPSEIDILNMLLAGASLADDSFFSVIKEYLSLVTHNFPVIYITRDGSVFTDFQAAKDAAGNNDRLFEVRSFHSDAALKNDLLHKVETLLDSISVKIYGTDYYKRSSYRLADDLVKYYGVMQDEGISFHKQGIMSIGEEKTDERQEE